MSARDCALGLCRVMGLAPYAECPSSPGERIVDRFEAELREWTRQWVRETLLDAHRSLGEFARFEPRELQTVRAMLPGILGHLEGRAGLGDGDAAAFDDAFMAGLDGGVS